MKYYRVKKDTFLWKQGAILKQEGNGYRALEDIWDAIPVVGGEYISTRIVEHRDNAAFFERIYQDTITGRLFRTKDQLSVLYEETFKA